MSDRMAEQREGWVVVRLPMQRAVMLTEAEARKLRGQLNTAIEQLVRRRYEPKRPSAPSPESGSGLWD